jgi:hypothetical protein
MCDCDGMYGRERISHVIGIVTGIHAETTRLVLPFIPNTYTCHMRLIIYVSCLSTQPPPCICAAF